MEESVVPTLFHNEQRQSRDKPTWWRRLFPWRGFHLVHGPAYPTRRIAVRATFVTLLLLSALFGSLCGLMLIYSVDLPQMDDLMRYRPDTTTELLDIHGREIGSFALERRAVGAAWRDLHSRSRAQGSSTLTMQLARNLFLSNEKTYGRKFQEILLAMQIEHVFTKDQIFAMYANQIYLGHGTYGFEAASQFYFSKHVHDLTLTEAALLAALPKGAEYYSPLNHPERALRRRNLVLAEMRDDGKITSAQEEAAAAMPLGLHIQAAPNSEAPYFVEEVRRQLEREFGSEEVHGAGLRIYTTLDIDLQRVANKAVLDGTAAYERRHGWKGHLQNIIREGQDPAKYQHPDWSGLAVQPGGYYHALVTEVAPSRVIVKIGSAQAVMTPADWRWTGQTSGSAFLAAGDIVYVRLFDGVSSTGA